jgi:DNA-binding GntR family transcriptional regulator
MGRRVLPRKGTGRDRAYDQLREAILSLSLAPGAPIDEAAIVRSLKLSRTPVREALIRLSGERLVELLPNRGARVADLPLTSLGEFFEALSLSQRATHRWAAARRSLEDLARIEAEHESFARQVREDPERIPTANAAFHLAVAQAGRNTFLARGYRDLLDYGLRLSRLTVIYDPPVGLTRDQHFDTVVAEHEAILTAVRNQDIELTERLASDHAELFRRRVLDYLSAPLQDGVDVHYDNRRPLRTARR